MKIQPYVDALVCIEKWAEKGKDARLYVVGSHYLALDNSCISRILKFVLHLFGNRELHAEIFSQGIKAKIRQLRQEEMGDLKSKIQRIYRKIPERLASFFGESAIPATFEETKKEKAPDKFSNSKQFEGVEPITITRAFLKHLPKDYPYSFHTIYSHVRAGMVESEAAYKLAFRLWNEMKETTPKTTVSDFYSILKGVKEMMAREEYTTAVSELGEDASCKLFAIETK
jgi:hypothetical protein